MTASRRRLDTRQAPGTVWLALMGSLLLWASAFVGIRAVLDDYGPGALALLRFVVASLGLTVAWLIVQVKSGERVRLPPVRDVPQLALLGLLLIVVYNLGLNFGERTVSAGLASFIVGQLPIFSVLMAAALLNERITAQAAVGIGVGAVGTLFMLFSEGSGVHFNIGTVYILAAVVGESLYFVLSKPMLWRYRPLELNFFITMFGTLLLTPFAWQVARQLPEASLGSTLTVVYLGIFPAAVAYVLWSYSLAHLSVSRTTSALYTLPFLTIVVALVLLGELPGLVGVIGGVISLVGAVLVNSARHSE